MELVGLFPTNINLKKIKGNMSKNIEIMNEQRLSKETETKPYGYTVLGTVFWEPEFYADIDENAEDGDYLREQQCCTSCGAHTGYLPGYYWIEDNDFCPKCRADASEEKWSDEVKRIMERNELPEDEINETVNALLECGL